MSTNIVTKTVAYISFLSELKYQEFHWSGKYFTTVNKQKGIELTLQKSFLCHAAQNYLLAYLVFCR